MPSPALAKTVRIPLETERKQFSGTPSDFDSELLGKQWSPKIQAELSELQNRRADKSTSETEELLAQLREGNIAAAKEYKLAEQKYFEIEPPRIGRRMHCSEFIRILRKRLRCWYNPVPFRGIVGLRAIRPSYEALGVQYVCGVKLGYTTEYDTFHYDHRGLATNKKTIGWRTVLLTLIRKRFLTEREAHQLFGKPFGVGSILYRMQLYEIRKERGIY